MPLYKFPILSHEYVALLPEEAWNVGIVLPSFLHLYAVMCAPAESDAERRQKLIDALHVDSRPDIETKGEIQALLSADQINAIRDAPDLKSTFLDLRDDGHLSGL